MSYMNLIVLMSTYTNYFALNNLVFSRFLCTFVSSLKTDIQWTIINLQWGAWSLHRAISPSFYLAQPGRNLKACCSITLISRCSPSSDDEHFFRARSILFTKGQGIHNMPHFSCYFATESLLRANSDFITDKLEAYGG